MPEISFDFEHLNLCSVVFGRTEEYCSLFHETLRVSLLCLTSDSLHNTKIIGLILGVYNQLHGPYLDWLIARHPRNMSLTKI